MSRQEFCGLTPGHPPHGWCGGYPPSPAAQPDLLAALQASVDAARTKFRTEPATVCVRLDGLADKIAAALGDEWDKGTTTESEAAVIVALLQSLAVQ